VFFDRNRRAGKHLEWKVGLFCVAAVVALAGIYMESRWWTGAAVVILMGGMLLKFVPSDADDAESDQDD
jgi:hypothetical protein